jgi:hypothetical protein
VIGWVWAGAGGMGFLLRTAGVTDMVGMVSGQGRGERELTREYGVLVEVYDSCRYTMIWNRVYDRLIQRQRSLYKTMSTGDATRIDNI